MPKPAKTFFNWSTGKDSALALYHLQQDARYSVEALITSVNAEHERVSMHGVRRSLIESQAAALSLPLTTVEIGADSAMGEYESKMAATMKQFTETGFQASAFGDIFLEDLRRYREEKLTAVGLTAVFPLWQRNTAKLMREFIALGFKAIVVCVNTKFLDQSFAGRVIDENFLRDLPAGVDPCGENGEFHTFCYAGPIFHEEIKFNIGERVTRYYKAPTVGEGDYEFCFCDLIPE